MGNKPSKPSKPASNPASGTTAAPNAAPNAAPTAAPAAPTAATLPAGCTPVVCTGKVHTTTATVGGPLALTVPGAGPNGAPATYLCTVPAMAGHKAGQPVLCKVGKVAKYWLGVDGQPLVCTWVMAACNGAIVAFTAKGNNLVVNAYPNGYGGAQLAYRPHVAPSA